MTAMELIIRATRNRTDWIKLRSQIRRDVKWGAAIIIANLVVAFLMPGIFPILNFLIAIFVSAGIVYGHHIHDEIENDYIPSLNRLIDQLMQDLQTEKHTQ